MWRWIINNPLISASAVVLGIPVVDFFLNRKARKELHAPVLKKMMSGSKPSIPLKETMIPRPKIEADISKMFLSDPAGETEFSRFGVVIGPSGCGKTSALRAMCNKHPQGVFYYEIDEPDNFISVLSEEIGMKTSPTTFIDSAIS